MATRVHAQFAEMNFAVCSQGTRSQDKELTQCWVESLQDQTEKSTYLHHAGLRNAKLGDNVELLPRK